MDREAKPMQTTEIRRYPDVLPTLELAALASREWRRLRRASS